MKPYPNQLSEKPSQLDAKILNTEDQGVYQSLTSRGLKVYAGLDENFVSQLSQLSQEEAIREYCPNDYNVRFKDLDGAKTWISKGRQAYTLVKENEQNELVVLGYGWAGLEENENAPGGKTTFALRLGVAAAGQGLATPFCRLIIAASHAQFGSLDFWLETWESNAAAVHIYSKLGFSEVNRIKGERLTTSGTTIEDTRLYMTLPNELL